MAEFNELGSGGVQLRGCAKILSLRTRQVSFAKGDRLYVAKKARRGILEPVVIKHAKLISNGRTGGQPITLYTDTLNALWNEGELVPVDQAMDMAVQFNLDLIDELNRQSAC